MPLARELEVLGNIVPLVWSWRTPLPVLLGSSWRVSNLYLSLPFMRIRHNFPLNIQGLCIISIISLLYIILLIVSVYSIQVEANRSPQ